MARNAPKGDVTWKFPDKKKPFAYTPCFVALQCNLLGDEANSRKPSVILKHIEDNHYVGLYELKAILQTYIDKGYGDMPCAFVQTHFKFKTTAFEQEKERQVKLGIEKPNWRDDYYPFYDDRT